EGVDDAGKLGCSRARRDPLFDALAAQRDADAFGLAEHKIGQRRDHLRAVFKFCFTLTAVRHRPAAIEHEQAAEVGLLVVLFDVGAIGACQHPPIEMPGIIAGRVEAMLAEFDAGAFDGAAVLAGDGSFNDAAGRELKMVEALDECGFEIAGDETHFEGMIRKTRTNIERQPSRRASSAPPRILRARDGSGAAQMLGGCTRPPCFWRCEKKTVGEYAHPTKLIRSLKRAAPN